MCKLCLPSRVALAPWFCQCNSHFGETLAKRSLSRIDMWCSSGSIQGYLQGSIQSRSCGQSKFADRAGAEARSNWNCSRGCLRVTGVFVLSRRTGTSLALCLAQWEDKLFHLGRIPTPPVYHTYFGVMTVGPHRYPRCWSPTLSHPSKVEPRLEY